MLPVQAQLPASNRSGIGEPELPAQRSLNHQLLKQLRGNRNGAVGTAAHIDGKGGQ